MLEKARAASAAGHYDSAVEYVLAVLAVDEKYDDGYVLLLEIASSFFKNALSQAMPERSDDDYFPHDLLDGAKTLGDVFDQLRAELDLPGFSGELFAPAVSSSRASPRRPPG
jgi:hypothetical protein